MERDRSAMRFHNAFHNRHSQAGSFAFPESDEWFEDLCLQLGLDATPGIADAKDDVSLGSRTAIRRIPPAGIASIEFFTKLRSMRAKRPTSTLMS